MVEFEKGGTLWNKSGEHVGMVQEVNYEAKTLVVWFFNRDHSDRLSFSTAETMGLSGIDRKGTPEVDHPSHYNQGGIEAIDSIRASLTAEEFSGFCKGNIMKYVIREKHKNGVEDLKKAQKYLEWLVEHKQNPDN